MALLYPHDQVFAWQMPKNITEILVQRGKWGEELGIMASLSAANFCQALHGEKRENFTETWDFKLKNFDLVGGFSPTPLKKI